MIEKTYNDILEHGYIDRNVDKRLVCNTITYVIDSVIKPLKSTLDDVFDADWLEYYVPVIAYFTNSELVMPLSYKTKNAGLLQNSGADYRAPSIDEIRALKDLYISRGEFYLKRLKKHLNKHITTHSTHFPIHV